MLESNFKQILIKKIKEQFEGCQIVFLSPENFQGIPDIAIFYKNKWAMLEGKKNEKASIRPNQKYWIEEFNKMSYASFIYPENMEVVLSELEQAFKS